jgi:copper(I)-binding protein
MFLGLKKPLKEGEAFSATLNFEKAGSVPVRFVVKGVGATAATVGEVHHH